MNNLEKAMPNAGSLFCFGLGYSAHALAATLGAAWRVQGTTRSIPAPNAADGVEWLPFTGEAPLADAAALAQTTHLLLSVPPDADGDPVLRHHAKILAACPQLRWIGYLSTTGVYGDHGGDWVDEETPPNPTTLRSRRRADAEQAWLAFGATQNVPVHVFRLAGIYGPGRNALEAIRAGRAQRICKPGQVFSRIHIADLVTALSRAMATPINAPKAGRIDAGRIYNVCDDRPAPPEDVIAFAAKLLGVEPPPRIPFNDAVLSDMAKSFYGENKRVRNARMKQELGVVLTYPDYEAGLGELAKTLLTDCV